MSNALPAGPVVIHTPTGPITGTHTPHTKQIWLDGGGSISAE
jgi:hypothetical protein